jgi:AAA family ATP:ADP antiporter
MGRRWRGLFDIRPGEGGPLAVCAIYVAIAVASFLLAKPIRNGLFLSEFGAYKLVYAYAGVPLVLLVFIPIYHAFAARVGQRLVITGSLIFLSLNVVAFWWALTHRPAPWISAAFYIWVNCYGVIAPVQAWSFANTVFDTRQARRLFGLVGAGASLGAILGGLLARVLVGALGAVNLLLVLAGLIASAAVVVNLGWRVRRRDLRPPRQSAVPFSRTLALIGRTRYLRLIAALIVLVAIVTQWTQFQFSLAAEARFAGNADSLTRFFGTFNFWMGTAAFLVQLFLTGPALRRFGVAFTILLLPLALGLGSTLVLLWPVLWSVMLTNALDQGLRFSVDKATFELLYMPVDPRVKQQVKSAIDLVINRVADAAGGILLGVATQGFTFMLFTLPGAGLGIRGISALVLVGVGAWVIVASALRRGYVEQIRDSIHRNRLEVERAATTTLDRSALDLLAGKIASVDAADVLYALDMFAAQYRGAMHPAVRDLLTHADPRIRCRAVEILDAAGGAGAAPAVEPLLRDPDLDTRTAALLYLAHHTGADPLVRIRELGDFADFSIQAGTIAFLGREGRSQNLEAARVLLDAMSSDTGEEGHRARLECARLAGRLPRELGDVLVRLLDDEAADVAGEAVISAGRLGDARFAAPLIAHLGRDDLREAAAEAIAAIGAGAVPALAAALAGHDRSVEIRREIPLVLARIGTMAAQEALTTCLMQADVTLRFRIIQGLNRLRELHPDLPLDRPSVEMVLGAEILGHYRSYQVLGTVTDAFEGHDPVIAGLRESMQAERERIFRLMGLLWPELDLKSVWVALQSASGAIRSNALELLDAELSPEMRRLVVPLFDGQVSVSERVGLAGRIVGADVESREEAVGTLLASEDGWLKACGVYAVGALRLTALADEIGRYANAPDPLLRETVRASLLRLKAAIEPPQDVLVTQEEAGWEPHHGEVGLG